MSKKSRLDLLVRVRYLNPLPPPPFPPKLFDIPSDISRLGEPSYLSQLASSAPLPMLVDSEMGMPLDLSLYDGVWDGDDSSLNPSRDSAIPMDPEDAILQAPVSAPPIINGVERAQQEVSWMRTSNLFMRKNQNRRRDAGERQKDEVDLDASEAAQLEAIEKSFTDSQSQDPTKVKHPDSKKRGLHVVESYEIFPDDNWGEVSYIMIRFPDRPSGVHAALNVTAPRPSSPRLKRALLLPRDNDGQQEIDYFLPQEEDIPRLDDVFERAVDEEVEKRVVEMAVDDVKDTRIDEIFPSTHYERARTYETVSAVKPQKEVILTFEEPGQGPQKRHKGVYYQNIFMRTLLRKSRAKRREESDSAQSADIMRVGYSQPSTEVKELRSANNAQVADPTWAQDQLANLEGDADDLMGEAMADGE